MLYFSKPNVTDKTWDYKFVVSKGEDDKGNKDSEKEILCDKKCARGRMIVPMEKRCLRDVFHIPSIPDGRRSNAAER